MVEFDSLWVHYYCPLAQLVERATVNRLVPGSSPGRTAKGFSILTRLGFVFFYKKKTYKNSQNHNDLLFSSYNVTA